MTKVKDKYEFILELLETGKLTPAQKERVMLLSTQELKNGSVIGEKFEERIKKLERIIYNDTPTPNEGDTNPPPTNETLSKYLHPNLIYKYLFEFNQNPILRTTCHEIDSSAIEAINEFSSTNQYDFIVHYHKILTAFIEHDKKFAPSSIKALIRGYLTGKNYNGEALKSGWSSNHIKIYWSDNRIPLWCKNYANLAPNSIKSEHDINRTRGFELGENSFTSQLTGKKVQTFRELVLFFKSLFHIRFGDDSLYNFITYSNKSKKWNENIEFDINETIFPKNIELFTDVDKLLQAYTKIIELIIEQHPNNSKPKVRLSFYELENKVIFSIHHINNTYNKTINNTKERLGQTYTNLINKQINGLCNLYLKADFGKEGYAMINIWNGKNREVTIIEMEKFNGGIEHLLEFIK